MEFQNIQPGLMVHVKGEGEMGSAQGQHVGTVDRMEGEEEIYLKLTKDDSPTGEHRWIMAERIDHADDKAVYLDCTLEEFNDEVLHFAPGELGEEQAA